MFLVPIPRTSDWVRSFLFDDSFDRLFANASTQSALPRSPALDVAESDQAYTVTLDLPGVAKDDVKVSIEGRRVQVQAQTGKSERAQGRRSRADPRARRIELRAQRRAAGRTRSRALHRQARQRRA